MKKTILITGSTDGIGLATAKMLADEGHNIIVHGRSKEKVDNVKKELKDLNSDISIDGFVADFSLMKEVKDMSEEVLSKYKNIDVLINNAGVYVTNNTMTKDKLELRFAVNTIAPYLLTKELLPIMKKGSRVINLSSAAQASVDTSNIASWKRISDSEAYAQSKLAITMWSFDMAERFKSEEERPIVIALNPKSFLASKMVKEAYGREGYDLSIGADLLKRASLSDEFADASGKYYDNDYAKFARPHPDALDEEKRRELVASIEDVLRKM